MQTKDNLIDALLSLVTKQEAEIKRLQAKIDMIMQYVDVYEDYIKGE